MDKQTTLGERFQPVVAALETWGNEYIDYIKQRNV